MERNLILEKKISKSSKYWFHDETSGVRNSIKRVAPHTLSLFRNDQLGMIDTWNDRLLFVQESRWKGREGLKSDERNSDAVITERVIYVSFSFFDLHVFVHKSLDTWRIFLLSISFTILFSEFYEAYIIY